MSGMKGVLLFLLCIASLVALGQPGDPGGGGNPTVPISGIEILIGGGAILGAKRLLSRYKGKKDNDPLVD